MKPTHLFLLLALVIIISSCNIGNNSAASEANDNELAVEESNIEPLDTTLSSVYLNIPISLTQNDCINYMNNLAKDSIIWEGWFMEDGIKYDFEQREAGITFATKEFTFESKFTLNIREGEYKTLTPRSSIFFYNNTFLALEVPLLTNNYESVIDLYKTKYGKPQILKKKLDEIYSKTDERIYYDYDVNIGKRVESWRCWKDRISSSLTEWVFNNLTIKIIYSNYTDHSIRKQDNINECVNQCNYVYIIYINHEAIEKFDKDIEQERQDKELIREQELFEQRRKDSVENQKSMNQYNSQHI